jgi:hypothetical protein
MIPQCGIDQCRGGHAGVPLLRLILSEEAGEEAWFFTPTLPLPHQRGRDCFHGGFRVRSPYVFRLRFYGFTVWP